MIYADTNATTPLASEVIEVITTALREGWANPSSGYAAGLRARAIVTEARQAVASMIGAAPNEIIFTSGGTEANHLVLYSVCRPLDDKGQRPHVISCPIEHDAILKPLRRMEEEGEIDLTLLPIDPLSGAVQPEAVTSALRQNTRLVTLMLANNETGALQPIAEISDRLSKWNASQPSSCRVLLHTDAAQAIGKVLVDAQKLGADYLTIVGHKFYGPRIGALFVRNAPTSAPLRPLFLGGGQEGGRRAGTENTPMVAGLGKACQLVTENLAEYTMHFARVRVELESGLLTSFGAPKLRFNSHFAEGVALPNTCNVSFLGVKATGREILAKCPEFAASVGAACHSNSCKPSAILLASGISPNAARSAIRLSLGRQTTSAEVAVIVSQLRAAVTAIEKEEANGC